MNGFPKRLTGLARWWAGGCMAGALALAAAGAAPAKISPQDAVRGAAEGDRVAIVELLKREKGGAASGPRRQAPRARRSGPPQPPAVAPVPGPAEMPERVRQREAARANDAEGGAVFFPAAGPPSPPLSASFAGVLDNATAFNPDTQGAVGTNHMMTVTASEIQFLTREGAEISRVTLSNFWANIGTNGLVDPFDPRLLYDPYRHRWIQVAGANPNTNHPGLLIAVSQGSDPTAGWHRYFIPTITPGDVFPDSSNVGFTRDWITVQANMLERTNYFLTRFDVWVFDKLALYNGAAASFRRFSLEAGPGTNQFGSLESAPVPAVTYDETVTTNYLVANWSGNTVNGGFLRLFFISTNSVSGELELTPGPFSFEQPFGGSPVWDAIAPGDDNFAPQLGTTNKIYLGDSRIQNCLYRLGTLWLAQTAFFPAGGSPTRAGVQWWEITPGGLTPTTTNGASVVQRGVIEDTTGARDYAFPSIAVNRRLDVLIGYSRFAANQYPSANYSFRIDADPLSSLRDDVVLKLGEASFYVPDRGYNYWGDWSAAVVDPNSDTDLWTVQEYASTPVAGSDRWGTWWGRLSPPSDLSVTITASPNPVVAGSNVTYSITVMTTNNRIARVTGVRLLNTLPAGAVLAAPPVLSQGTYGETNGVVTCDFGMVEDTGRATATLTVRLNNSGTANNSVTVSAYGTELTPANNTASVNTTVLPSADLAVTAADAPDPVTVSNTLAYTLTITNRGPTAAAGVLLTNVLPPAMTFISSSPSQGTCGRSGNIVNCSLGTIPLNGFATVQILIAPTAPGTITNRVHVVSSAFEPVPVNNTNLITTLANASPTLGFISDRTINEDAVLSSVAFQVGDFETPAGSLVLTGFCSNPAIVPNTNIVFGGSGSSRTVTVTPAPNANGVVTITRIVTDALGATATNVFQLTVLPVNDPPTISDTLNFSLNEDTATNVTVSIGDIETSASALTMSAASTNTTLVPNGNLVFQPGGGATRTLAITPAPNQSGVTLISVTVSDGTNTTSDTFVLTVINVNDPPTMTAIAARSVNEDTSTGPVPFVAADFETPGASLDITGFSSDTALVPNANITIGGAGTNRTVAVLPGTNQFGVVTISVRVADTDGAAVTNSFQLTVNAVNDPPAFNAISDVVTNEDSGPVTVSLAGIGPGAANESQDVLITASSGNTALIPNPTVNYTGGSSGSLVFTPVANSNGTAVITVTANDGGGSNNVTVRTFNVTVTAVNDPPSISDISDRFINEDANTGPVSFTIADVDHAVASLTLSGASSDTNLVPAGGIVFGGAGSSRTVTVTPAPNAFGVCTITVTVSDGSASALDAFTLTVLPVNDAPTISALSDRTIAEDTVTNLSFTVGDLETAAGSLNIFAISSNPGLVPNGNLVPGGSGSARTLAITPAADQFGSAIITVVVMDAEGGTNASSFLLTVTALNDPPTLAAINDVTVNEDDPQQSVVLTGISGGPGGEPQTVTLSAVSSAPSIVPNPVIGHTNGNSAAVLRFTPAPNASGDATITVTVDDGAATNGTATRTFVIHVTGVNDDPLVSGVNNQTMAEDATLAVGFTVFDFETSGDGLLYAASSSNQELIEDTGLTFGGGGTNRTVTIRPLTNAFGSSEITILVSDPQGGLAMTSFEVTVQSVNDAPVISAFSSVTVNEDTATAVIPFTYADGDDDVANVTLSLDSSNPALAPVANITLGGSGGNRTLTITPVTNQFGTSTITVSVADPHGARSSNSFLLTVQSVNDLPTLTDVSDLALDEDGAAGPVAFTVGDVETAAGALTVTFLSSNPALLPTNNIALGGAGAARELTLTPVANRSGAATVTVTVTDGDNGPVSDMFVVTVHPVNDPPALAAIPNLTTNEDSGPVTVPLSGISAGPEESQALTVTATSSDPAIVPHPSVNYATPGVTGSLVFTPVANAHGTVSITVVVMDDAGSNSMASRSFDVTVTAVNDPPTLDAIASLTLAEDSPAQMVPLTGIGSGAPDEAQTLTVTATSSDTNVVPHPAVTYASPGAAGTIQFAPVPNAFGSAMITVTVNDGGAVNPSVSRAFTVTVTNINDPPSLAGLAPFTMNRNTTTNISFTVADPDHAAGSLTVIATSLNTNVMPASGVTPGGTGSTRTLTLTPAPNQFGPVTIAVSVSDPSGAAVTNNLSVLVLDVDTPPVISNIADRSAAEDSSVTVPFTIGDVETPLANLALTAVSSNTALVANQSIAFGGSGSNRTVLFTPRTNQTGTTLITVTVTDASGNAASDSFLLTVTNINDLPTITGLPALTINEDTATGPLSFTVGDVETAAGTLAVTAASSNPALVPNGNIVPGGSGSGRTITVTPLANQSGSTTITLVVSDGSGGSNTTSFVLTVAPVNDPPVLDAIANRTVAEDAPAQQVTLTGISAGPSESQSLTITAVSSVPSLVPNPAAGYTNGNATGVLTFTPVANATGTATITVTVSDGGLVSAVRTFTVTVTPANDAPTISAIAAQTMLEDTVLTVPFTVSDAETAGLSLAVTVASTNANVLPATNIFLSGAGASRTLTFAPRPQIFGTSLVTVAVSDGVASNATSFLVNVVSVNDPPTLNQMTNVNVAVSPGALTLPLQGISPGGSNETEAVTFSTTNSRPSGFWTTIPSVTYSGGSTGILNYRPANGQTGTVTVAVLANDGRASNNITVRTFTLNVRPSANVPPTMTAIASQTINEDAVLGPLAFTARDAETPAASLVFAALSTNETLFPPGSIVFGGAGSNRNVTLTPAANRSGVSLIRLTVIDGSAAGSNMNFTVTVNPSNDVPALTGISNVSTPENTPSAPVLFNVSDVETVPAALTVTATSGNQTVVPNANIVLGGSGTNRALVITPATNQTGSAVITVTVGDGAASTNTTFTLSVTPVNDPPALSDIADQTVAEGAATAAIAFAVDDLDTPLSSLTLASSSSNPALIPTSNIVFGGAGGARTVTLTPLANQSGQSLITVSVSDGANTNSDTFLLTVTPVNDPPTLAAIGNLSLNQNAPQQTVNLSGIGSGHASESQTLSVTASSSNPALIPHPAVIYASPAAAGSLTFTPVPGASGTATITVTVNDGQPQNNLVTRTFTVTVNGVPALAVVPNQIVTEDGTLTSIGFTVSDPESAASAVTVTGASSNTGLVPNANVLVTGTGGSRAVAVTPLPDLHGNTFITLTATDPEGNSSTSSFLVTVVSVNDAPTLDPIASQAVPLDSGAQAVALTGISAGAPNETQPLFISAFSLNPTIVSNPVVNYTSPDAAGTLTFQPVPGATGTVSIVVTVDDGQSLNNLASRSFSVTVNPAVVDAPQLRIELAGGRALVSWPDTAGTNWILQAAASVAGVTTWRGVPAPPVTTAGRHWVTNSLADAARYFRLCNGCPPLYSPPELNIRKLTGLDFRVSWSAAFGDFTLETRPSAVSGSWTTISGPPVIISGTNNVFLDASAPAAIYRLRGP